MPFPYFTEPDKDLIRSGSGRDFLGLQPVWSGFGRKLVPHLATPVTQITGIKAVLLIHWLADEPLKDFFNDEKKRGFRSFFRLMEGILEFFLWKSSSEDNVQFCYGTRALEAERDEFQVTCNDGRTAVNGLYQYYRGTCRRAKLLSDEWAVAENVSQIFQDIWGQNTPQSLIEFLSPSFEAKEARLKPIQILERPELQKMKDFFSRFFSDDKINDLLRKQLLGDQPYIKFAQKCAKFLDTPIEPEEGWIKWRVDNLTRCIDNDLLKCLSIPMENVLKCEPFLLVLQDCFDYMRASQGAKISLVVDTLKTLEPKLREKAQKFLLLEDPLKNSRTNELISLAETLKLNLTDFLKDLLAHHKKCMAERERDPLVFLDGVTLVVTGPSDRDKKSIEDRLKQGTPWQNDYYFWTAGNIVRQLFGGLNG